MGTAASGDHGHPTYCRKALCSLCHCPVTKRDDKDLGKCRSCKKTIGGLRFRSAAKTGPKVQLEQTGFSDQAVRERLAEIEEAESAEVEA